VDCVISRAGYTVVILGSANSEATNGVVDTAGSAGSVETDLRVTEVSASDSFGVAVLRTRSVCSSTIHVDLRGLESKLGGEVGDSSVLDSVAKDGAVVGYAAGESGELLSGSADGERSLSSSGLEGTDGFLDVVVDRGLSVGERSVFAQLTTMAATTANAEVCARVLFGTGRSLAEGVTEAGAEPVAKSASVSV